jgi:hypothetical protein
MSLPGTTSASLSLPLPVSRRMPSSQEPYSSLPSSSLSMGLGTGAGHYIRGLMSGRRTQAAPCLPTFPSFPDSAFMEVGSAPMMTVDYPPPSLRFPHSPTPLYPVHCLRGRFSGRCLLSHTHIEQYGSRCVSPLLGLSVSALDLDVMKISDHKLPSRSRCAGREVYLRIDVSGSLLCGIHHQRGHNNFTAIQRPFSRPSIPHNSTLGLVG